MVFGFPWYRVTLRTRVRTVLSQGRGKSSGAENVVRPKLIENRPKWYTRVNVFVRKIIIVRNKSKMFGLHLCIMQTALNVNMA